MFPSGDNENLVEVAPACGATEEEQASLFRCGGLAAPGRMIDPLLVPVVEHRHHDMPFWCACSLHQTSRHRACNFGHRRSLVTSYPLPFWPRSVLSTVCSFGSVCIPSYLLCLKFRPCTSEHVEARVVSLTCSSCCMSGLLSGCSGISKLSVIW